MRVDGHFGVSGGSGNDIEAYVFDDSSFTAWQDRHAAVPIYSSGRVTEGNIRMPFLLDRGHTGRLQQQVFTGVGEDGRGECDRDYGK